MILKRLEEWGVEPSQQSKKECGGTEITDGTRFLRVRFNDKVRSLPYSTKLDTVRGAEYFRVLHNRQVLSAGCVSSRSHLQRVPGVKCFNPGVVEDISEASEMEEGELEEGPVDTKVFGSPNDEPRGRGMRRNRSEEKKTSSENAGRAVDAKWTRRGRRRKRVSSTEGELGKDTGLR
ncbi:hypothetical protein F7725_024451 [Dissostichus mawsoni]|uniref:Uncharacterized protein n=1 Tax=Dissostichus mawsoni TaxID=36200 RepID=A0A7J5XZJ9_DISMA|nr:hypothetical protein F7725_024451 [Dissostichus mawsoni]